MSPRRLLTGFATVVVIATGAAVGAPVTASGGERQPGGFGRDGFIVWTHRAAPGSEHLRIARPSGRGARDLTDPITDTIDFDAQVSPDGRWIAYERDTEDSSVGEVRLVRPDGTGDHALDVPCVDPCVAVVNPTWLSDNRLAVSTVSGPFDTGNATSVPLWTVRRDGSQLRRFTSRSADGVFEDNYLRMSRDGKFLTFRRISLAKQQAALFRSDLNGRHLQQLTPYSLSAEVYDLSTARRGGTKDLIVFESFARGGSEESFVDLGTVPATCDSLRQCRDHLVWLTDNAATGRRNANPQWSPDGRSLVFTDRPSFQVEDANVFTMRFGGDRRRQVTRTVEFDYRPAWGVRR